MVMWAPRRVEPTARTPKHPCPSPLMVRMRVQNGVTVLASLLVIVTAFQFGAAPVAGDTDDVVDVDVGNFFFDPEDVTLNEGDTVHWIWVGGTHGIETPGGEEWCGIQSGGTCDKVFDTAGTFDYRCTVHPTSMTGTITVLSAPPVVTILTPAPGAELDGTITFSGTATHSTGIASVQVKVDDDAYAPATLDGDTWTATIDTTAYANGAHTLTALATANDEVETTASVDVTFANPAVFDLSVDDVVGTTGLGPLQPTTITATIGNAGNEDLTGVRVLFQEIVNGEFLQPIGEVTVDVAAGGTAEATIVWEDLNRIGSFDVRVDVDPDDEVAETNEFNNDDVGTAAFWTDAIPGMTLG